MTALLLRLSDLPGFDPRGLDVYDATTGELLGLAGHRLANGADVRLLDEDLIVPARSVSVSAADPATRDRLARWLAERVGLEVGATAPTWARSSWGWALRGPSPWLVWVVTFSDPAVAEALDLADPAADHLALAAVCRHVGGTP